MSYAPVKQYTEGDVDPSITGIASMWEDSGDTLRAASAAKPLPVGLSGVISAGNSTDTPLGIGGAFTGVWEDVLPYASIRVFAIADQRTGTAEGCHLQFSTDGVTLMDEYLIPYRGTGSTPAVIPLRASVPRLARYFRVRYVNSETTAQTSFHLQTSYHSTQTQEGLVLANGLVAINGAIKVIELNAVNTALVSAQVVAGLGSMFIRVFALQITAVGPTKISLTNSSGGTVYYPATPVQANVPFVLNLLPFGWLADGGIGQAIHIRQTPPLTTLTGFLLSTRI